MFVGPPVVERFHAVGLREVSRRYRRILRSVLPECAGSPSNAPPENRAGYPHRPREDYRKAVLVTKLLLLFSSVVSSSGGELYVIIYLPSVFPPPENRP